MRKYDDDEYICRQIGTGLERDKIAFIPYFPAWENYDGDDDIVVVIRGKSYYVTADSVMYLKNEPVYIWALLREISKTNKVGYYDEIGNIHD